MDLYGLDYSLFDLGYSDDPTFIDSLSRNRREMEEDNLLRLSNSILKDINRNQSPPKHRHDGTSPLPLGMDWSPPPRNWNGPNTIWPHGSNTGWSYCVTIPSWSILSEAGGSEPIVFYRVEVALQSPNRVTTVRGVLKRFSDFLKLSTDLKRSFQKKKLPQAPPKGILRMKSRPQFEERRSSLEDWMGKVLSDIDLSRSASVACFLELEAAARFSFNESTHQAHYITSGCSSDIGSTLNSEANNSEFGKENQISEDENNTDKMKTSSGIKVPQMVVPLKDLANVSGMSSDLPSEMWEGSVSSKCSEEGVVTSETVDTFSISDLQIPHDTKVVLPTDVQHKMDRLLNSMQHKLVTSKADMENVLARFNQEVAVRQYLSTKVKDLETELESSRKSCMENLEQAILIERETYTQAQWNTEELKQKYMDMEFKLKAEQEKTAHAEETKTSIIQVNESLQKELESAREQIKTLQKSREEMELKSKSDVKLLAREVKLLRNSQSSLREQLEKLSKEKSELEGGLLKEKKKREYIDLANTKLLHECKILRSRLEECSISFLLKENCESSNLNDVVDMLAISENRAALLIAEAQLFAKGDAIPIDSENDDFMTVYKFRKMLTDAFIDNALLMKRVNSIFQCALETDEEDTDLRKTLLRKLFEKCT